MNALAFLSLTQATEYGMRKLVSFALSIITLVPIVLIFSFALEEPAHAAAPNDIAGDWATPGLGAVVRLSPCAATPTELCGRLMWAWDSSRLRHGAVASIMIEHFAWDGAAWSGGRLHNPEDGRTYSGTITLDGEVLRLRGCAGPFCQTQTWRRLSSIPHPSDL